MRRHYGRVQALLLIAIAAIIGSALATGAFAGSKHVPKWRISAFSHPLRRAKGASATAVPTIPIKGVSGVSLAAVEGANEVYIGHRYSPTTLDCFWERTPSGGHGGCGRARELEEKGAVSLYEADEHAYPHILALVPDGVTSVLITDGDGSSHTVAVANNFAVYEDLRTPASVSFTLPNGATETTNVSAWRTPQRPGAPGSSEQARP
jgi:hypothetical protein